MEGEASRLKWNDLDLDLKKALRLLKRRKKKVLKIFGCVRRHMADSNPMTLAYGVLMPSRWAYLSHRDKDILQAADWDASKYDAFSVLWERNDRVLPRQYMEEFVKEFLEK